MGKEEVITGIKKIIKSKKKCHWINSLPASDEFCCLLIIFTNSLDPDQAWQNVGPDLDPNHLTFW